MDKFLINVEKNSSGIYEAMFSDGSTTELSANNYADALTEADNVLENYFENNQTWPQIYSP